MPFLIGALLGTAIGRILSNPKFWMFFGFPMIVAWFVGQFISIPWPIFLVLYVIGYAVIRNKLAGPKNEDI